jgi:hypothetical protein
LFFVFRHRSQLCPFFDLECGEHRRFRFVLIFGTDHSFALFSFPPWNEKRSRNNNEKGDGRGEVVWEWGEQRCFRLICICWSGLAFRSRPQLWPPGNAKGKIENKLKAAMLAALQIEEAL